MTWLKTSKLYLFGMCAVVVLICVPALGTTDGSRFDPADFTPLGTLAISSGSVAFDTATGSVTGFGNGTLTTTQGGRAVTVYCFNNISVTGTATITVAGTRGLVLLSRGNIVLDANADINGNALIGSGITGGAGVLGGYNGGNANLAGQGPGAGGRKNNDAGAGAGYGGLGGAGAASNTNGRVRYPDPPDSSLYDLYGGSGGGGGGDTKKGGSGGGGGGAVALCAAGSITINAGCIISVNGGGGAFGDTMGGGGGSGGSILLSAPTVTNNGTLKATGGNGGGANGDKNLEGGGGGGGGRIAIYANVLSAGIQNVAGGSGGTPYGGTAGGAGDAGTTFTDDFSDPPMVDNITLLNSSPTNAATVNYRVVFTVPVTGVQLSDFSLAQSGISGATVDSFTGWGTTYDVAVSTGSGEGTLRLNVLDFDTIKNAGLVPLGGAGSGNGDFITGAAYSIDTVEPTISIGDPTPAITRTGPVTFTVTYGGASSVNLPLSSVHLTAGTATGTVAVSGSGTATRTITISAIGGNGTLAVSVDAGTATDGVGNTDLGAGPSAECTVDNMPPGIGISPPSSSMTVTGPVSYTVTYTDANLVTLVAGNVTLQRTGTAWGTVSVLGSGTSSRTVQINSITGDGTLWISIAAGTASDSAGNTAPAAGPSEAFTVTNTGISVSIAPPSVSLTRSGPVSYAVTYSGATSVTLSPSNIVLNSPGTATGTVAVSGGGNKNCTVTISNISGNGPLGISIVAGTATALPSFSAPAAGPSATFTVDNTPPSFVVIPPPNNLTCGTANIKWQVSFADAEPCVMNDSFITIELTGTLTGTFSVVAMGDQTRNVFVKNVEGIGTAVLSIAAGAAEDEAGNLSAAWGPSEAVYTNGDPPPMTISPPSATITRNGPVTYTVTYENATSITLSPAYITLVPTGHTANAQVSVSGTGLEPRTVTLSNITGDGTLGISINAGTASDVCGQLTPASAPSETFTVDNTPPSILIGPPSTSITKHGPVTYTVTYTDAAAVTLAASHISLQTTGTATAAVAVTGGGTTTRTVTLSSITGDGTLAILIAEGSASDELGNQSVAAGPSVPFTVDNTRPSLSVGAPSTSLTRTGPVTYTVTFTGADSVLLAPGLVTLNKTGSANGTVNVLGSGTDERTVEITGISGTGTLGIGIAAGSATDLAGNSALAWGPSSTFVVDNTPPGIAIGPPSASVTRSGPVSYTVTYTGASAITLADTDLLLTTTGTAGASVAVSGSETTTRTVTFTSATGDGEIGFSIQPGTAVDLAGNVAGAGGPSQSFTVDNTPPGVQLGTPSPDITRNGPVSSVVTYQDAASISLSPANVTLQTTGTASASVGVTGSGTGQRTVTFSSVAGNGTIAYSIGASTAQDAAGNPAGAAGPSASFTVDNTAPGISIGPPSSTITSRGPVTYTVTYTDADTISLAPADITLVRTGTANGVVAVGGSGNGQRTVTVQNIVGIGAIAIGIAAGSAHDLAGNPAPAAGPSASFEVNNEAISVSIGAPSAYITTHGPVTYPITYDNARSVSLSNDDITLNTTDTAHGTAVVSDSGVASHTVSISGITGNGTISISIAAGTGLDDLGDPAPGAGPSAAFTVDNTPPTISLGSPSVTLTRTGPVAFQVQYGGSSSVTLQNANVTINKTGTANAAVGVSGSGTSARTVTLSDVTGDGTLGITILSGTAVDEAGNLAPLAGPSAVVTVDNTSPVVTISGPTPGLTKAGPAAWTLDFGDAESVLLSPAHLTLVKTGNANAVPVITGSGAGSRTVTLYNATGNGTIALSVAADSAQDAAGNPALAAGPSVPVTIDNMPPVIAMIGDGLVEIEYTLPYVDAGATAIDNVDGTITNRIEVANYVDTEVPGAYTVSYNVSDTAGNAAQTVVRTVQVVRMSVEQMIFELLGRTVCRPGICVTINGNRVFTPAGVIRLVIDRPSLQLFPPDMLDGVVPGTWFDLQPNWLSAVDMGSISLYYDDEDQDGIIDGTESDETELFVYFLDPATGEVLPIQGTVHWIDNCVQAPITRFGVYALGSPVKVDEGEWDPDAPMPVSGTAALFVCVLLLGVAGYVFIRPPRRVVVRVIRRERQ